MGMCYKSLSQWDAAEEAFAQSLQIYAVVGPQGHDQISMSEIIEIETVVVVNNHYDLLFL